MFIYCRSGVPQLLFVITDGVSSNPTRTADAAEALHDSGITTFGIGVGKAKRSDLAKIASHPELIYLYDDFDILSKFKDVFVEESCQGKNMSMLVSFWIRNVIILV